MDERLMLDVDYEKFESEIINKKHLSGKWKRNFEREQNLYKDGDPKLYCFDYLGNEFPHATISFRLDGTVVKVSNIGPKPAGSFTLPECNALLTNFIAKNLIEVSHKLYIT